MVLEIPAYDSYYEVAPVKMCQAQEIGNPRMWNPPSLPSLISSKIFSLLPDAVSLILFNFHCYAIVLTPEFRGAFCKINHDDGDTYIKLTRWPIPCQTQFKLPLPIYQQSKPPLSGPC